MSSYARAIILGRVGVDPEVQEVGSQARARVRLRVAVNRIRYDPQTQEYQRIATDWYTVIFWDEMARRVARNVRKGDLIFVEGDLRTRQWEDPQGNSRIVTEIHAVLYRPLRMGAGPAEETELTEEFSAEAPDFSDLPGTPVDIPPEDSADLPSDEFPADDLPESSPANQDPNKSLSSRDEDSSSSSSGTRDDLPF